MREIKFRAWDKELKMMIHNKEQAGHIEYDTNPVHAINIMFNEDDYGLEYMQYIGLKDKNVKEIYEGDIVRYNATDCYDIEYDQFAVIEWNGTGWYYRCFKSEKGSKRQSWLISLPGSFNNDNGICEVFEVIGNIYENPELLKD